MVSKVMNPGIMLTIEKKPFWVILLLVCVSLPQLTSSSVCTVLLRKGIKYTGRRNMRTKSWSDGKVTYNLFPACPHSRKNFLEEFLVGHKLKLLSLKVHTPVSFKTCV